MDFDFSSLVFTIGFLFLQASAGHRLGLQWIMLCPKELYWDELLRKCIPCRVACHPLKVKGCTDVCISMDCRERVGFFYDELLRKCINCSSICGQHPVECRSFCRIPEDLATTLPVPAALQAMQCKLDGSCNQPVMVYLVLGLCLCTLLFSLLLTWIYFRRSEEDMTCRAGTVSCHKREDSPKDRLMEAGSMGSGSSGSQTPEPVETCGFCFPEASPAVQETRECHRTYQLGMQRDAAVAGTIPTPEDGHFQIICSPSQEKMQMT